MRRGNERLELLRSGMGVPRETSGGLAAGKKIAEDDPHTPLFREPVSSGSCPQDPSVRETTIETGTHACQCCATATHGKDTHASVGALSNYKVSRLVHKKVKAEGSVPRKLVLRSRSAEIAEEVEPVQAPLLELVSVEERVPVEEPVSQPAPAEELRAKHVVTVVPTPRKARVRTPKLEEKEAAPAPAPKPLKVIRRRREETPKVFETTAKSFPRAMLEGVDIELGENNHRQID
jgi:hypothetical protein